MQLIIQDGQIIAMHEDEQVVAHLYPGCECIIWNKSLPACDFGFPEDPRSEEEKQLAYKERRRVDYPSIKEQLDMLYHDQIDGTSIWLDTITAIKEKWPKPQEILDEREN